MKYFWTKLLLLPMVITLGACAKEQTKSRSLKDYEILFVYCDAESCGYYPDRIQNGIVNYNYLQTRELTFTYSSNQIVVHVKFSYIETNTTYFKEITDTYYGNVSWAIFNTK